MNAWEQRWMPPAQSIHALHNLSMFLSSFQADRLADAIDDGVLDSYLDAPARTAFVTALDKVRRGR